MAFLERNRIKSYKLELGEVTNPNPLTIKYPYEKTTPHYLVKFIWLIHERKGLIPTLPFPAYVRHVKKLLEEINEEEILSLVLKANETCNYVFTVRYLRKLHEENNNTITTKRD